MPAFVAARKRKAANIFAVALFGALALFSAVFAQTKFTFAI